jgi:hypothetical protein
MGHLDNTERVIEVRLTSLGRQKLAEGKGIDVTQFALSDDEVDYGLWQEGVPQEDRGAIIENLPVFEALPDEKQSMRYKLITLAESSDKVPKISLPNAIRLDGEAVTLSPTTKLDGDETTLDRELGYTAYVEEEDVLNIITTESADQENGTIPAAYGDRVSNSGILVGVGTEFEIEQEGSLSEDVETRMTFVGNESGLTFEVLFNVIVS